MSYLKKSSLLQQQQELQELIDKRLKNEESPVKKQVYQWLNNNQYFVDNELFDFYFCVAQNIAAVEVLGNSGEKITKAKKELEESAETYKKQIVDTSNWIIKELKDSLDGIQLNQNKLDIKLIEVLEELSREHQNIKIVSTGLVNSTSILLKKQKQLMSQTEVAKRYTRQTLIVAGIILVITLLGCMAILIVSRT